MLTRCKNIAENSNQTWYGQLARLELQDEAEEVSEQYSGDEPVHETNRKSHSHSDGEPVSDTNRKLPYNEIAPRPLN